MRCITQWLTEPEPGDNVGFNVRGLAAVDIRRGDVAGYTDSAPTFVRHDETFVGQISIMGIPKAVSVGYTPVFHAHTAQVAIRFLDLLEKTNKKGKEANPSFLKTGDQAMIRFQPTKPFAIEQLDTSLNCPDSLFVTWVRQSPLVFV